MAKIHKPEWEKAGIFDAVMNSVYQIERDDELVFGLAEKWCSKTNSFVFPWGEATLTLEDMAVYGFSVSGSPVFLPVAPESEEIKQRLEMAIKELKQTKSKKAATGMWIPKFRDSGSSIEHEAFLVAWLSDYVFGNTCYSIRNETIPIAIHLARGTRVALGPAVLASIYHDLTVLKSLIVRSPDDASSSAGLYLWSPFQLVQVWAWERFPKIQPLPDELGSCQPRLARWSMKEEEHEEEHEEEERDSDAENFIWRPYTLPLSNWDFPKFYCGKEKWVELNSSGSDDDDYLVGFARCLRVSSLVGMDTIEKYFPHRVAMQFGFDQDIPGCVADDSDESFHKVDAWKDYCVGLDGVRLYIPPRLFEADVTTRYRQWWKHEVVELQRTQVLSLGYQERKLTGKKRTPKTADGFGSKRNKYSNSSDQLTEVGSLAMWLNARDDDAEDNMTIAQLLKASKKINGDEVGNSSVHLSNGDFQFTPEEDQKSQGEGSGLMVTAELRKSGTDTDRGYGGSGKISSSGQLPENENHSNTSGAVISNQYREVIASSRLGPMIARIDEALSYLEKMFGLQ
ncbi:Protein MAINTENANCE OF MERISTEMS [Linum perenne]